MNDRHPSGDSNPTVHAPDASYGLHAPYEQQGTHHGYAGYDGYSTGTFDNLDAAYGDGDPLFGAMPGTYGTGTFSYDAAQGGDAAQWPNGAGQTAGYEAYGAQPTTYDTGVYDTGGHATGSYGTGQYDISATWDASSYDMAPGNPAQASSDPLESAPLESTAYATGQWDASGWDATGQYESGQYDAGQWNSAEHWNAPAAPAEPAQSWDAAEQHQDWNPAEQHQAWDADPLTEVWDASAYATAEDAPGEEPYGSHGPGTEAEPEPVAAFGAMETSAFEALDTDRFASVNDAYAEDDATVLHEAVHGVAYEAGAEAGPPEGGATPAGPDVMFVPGPRRAPQRNRRRVPARRSAILTVAVPSIAVMGVAGIAAASVSTGTDQDDAATTQAAPDTSAVKPSAANSKLDTQLETLTADADDFADRASRTQERIDLKQRQIAEKKRKEAEAARREALRPKFAIPVEQHGLSATFGQAGVNWMSVHSGIDFPVSYGTPVMAATDGTVRTQYNIAYGNMAIVTAADGTETWYCHLSSTKIRSGSVKAGDVIAYSGNSGNSTGPHLHFEVHPGGDAAIDPLPWLRDKGLEPS
ncbi:peptidoglycan DD-metalloendopeptidase family protein [Streptomyces sp. 8N706]|uniref:peptidoglycan DD-metalloendopeptidase family protein n=1 Tax=Streptomyces sp. 8N706 TaxID=3457416 RepID=UPI003FD0DACF